MNNKTLFNHPVLGIITPINIINDLKLAINYNKNFEDIIFSILRETQMTDEDIATIFSYSVVNRLEWIFFLLENYIKSNEK